MKVGTLAAKDAARMGYPATGWGKSGASTDVSLMSVNDTVE